MNIVIIQPPTTQLNAPYPSGAYLASFFRTITKNVKWHDFNIALYEKVFSRQGLSEIFATSEKRAIELAQSAENGGDIETAYQLRRYIINAEKWINWIEKIRAILSVKTENTFGREHYHELVFSPHAPRGSRMENYLANIERAATEEDAQSLATFALADLADYISVAYDENFALVRYAEHLSTSATSINQFAQKLDSPILVNFLQPIIDNVISESFATTETVLFCISVPFPGCFASALYTARAIKNAAAKSGAKAIVSIGGGYCSTELRETSEPKLSEFIDIISFDRGYSTYAELLSRIQNANSNNSNHSRYYIEESLSTPLPNARIFHGGKVIDMQTEKSDCANKADISYTQEIFPDYTDIDFSRYPRLCDDENPMHRLWSSGSYLKTYLAHGCYWHRCAFCDTQLDYVCGYKKLDATKIFRALYEQAEKTGIHAIHFVDEAAPPVSLKEFALQNIAAKNAGKIPLAFWGNIRFEKVFTRDFADLLSYGGLTAVSGGIEIATGEGLASVNKGNNIDTIVSALCALKEAGILVHAYMIFGYFKQSPQDIINSLETLRQLFSFGLIDSAFFHKFVLTRHSTLFSEYLAGKHPDLKPKLPENGDTKTTLFAMNDIRFEGEEKSEKFSAPLSVAVNSWMHGKNLDSDVRSFFEFKVPPPTIPKNFIEKKIAHYEAARDSAYNDYADFVENKHKYFWLGGNPILIERAKNKLAILWSYMGEIFEVSLQCNKADALKIVEMLKPDSALPDNKAKIPENLYAKLRRNGLVQI